mmetsp:Transcript_9682/g.16287  ORF Transcript_9682/g.16287 Transcript_9682/m.16287 type:complete len:234 (-) Transcript_9682:135-836(-)
MPASEFYQIKEKLLKVDSTVVEQRVDGRQILVSKNRCERLYSVYGDLEFLLHNTKIQIKPQGYLYSEPYQSDCFVGIERIPDRMNQYRLGTIFLRNFFTGLDYENGQILIGLNYGTSFASISGGSPNPFIKDTGNGAIVFVLCFLLILLFIAIIFYFRARQHEKERLVTFAKPSKLRLDDDEGPEEEQPVKRYRNGVELKPSEIAKQKKKEGRLLPSVNESGIEEEETFDDQI